MSELIKRLRSLEERFIFQGGSPYALEIAGELERLRAALQQIADGKDNLGWAPCSSIAEKALQEVPE